MTNDPRGHTSAFANATRIVDENGTVLKDQMGPLPSGNLPAAARKPRVTLRQAQAPAPSGQRDFLAVVMEAASNPAVDAVKMAALYDLAERHRKAEAERAYARAFKDLQMALPTITRDGKIQITDKRDKDLPEDKRRVVQNTKFASLANLVETCRPILFEYGFSLSFRPGTAHDNRVQVTCILRHDDGHSESATQTGPADTTGSKNDLQGIGSSDQYLSRYLMIGMLAIVSRDPKDDSGGKLPDQAAPLALTADKAQRIETLIRETNTPLELVLTAIGAEAIERMTPAQAAEAEARLLARKKALERKVAQ